VRLVLDLKSEVKTAIIRLKPVGEYGYRLVLGCLPVHPVVRWMALVDEPAKLSHPANRPLIKPAIAARRPAPPAKLPKLSKTGPSSLPA